MTYSGFEWSNRIQGGVIGSFMQVNVPQKTFFLFDKGPGEGGGELKPLNHHFPQFPHIIGGGKYEK